jgi:hypothetical protein
VKALEPRGLRLEHQKNISFEFEGLFFKGALRADLVVEDKVIVEINLRLSGLPVGLLTNFGAARLKDGLHRIVNALPPSESPRLRVNQQSG